jgi:3-hydroxyisobutyrate dehydrogenase-like beta-hydroxyacid dehydrogenase
MKLMAKDLAYSVAVGKKHSVNLGTVATAHAALQQGIAAGLGEKDFSAVVELLRKK